MVLPDLDEPRWWDDPLAPSSHPLPSAPPPTELSADERSRQLERFRRQRALEARLAASKTRQVAPSARGAWGTATAPEDDSSQRSTRRPRRRSTPFRLLSIAVVTAVLGGGTAILAVWALTGNNLVDQVAWDDIGRRIGLTEEADGAPGSPSTPEGWGDDNMNGGWEDDAVVEQVDLPPPGPAAEASPTPLGTPPPMPTQPGDYGFIAFQPGSDQPVAYDPCRPIRYVVNNADAPAGADQLVADAVAEVGAATGLVFAFVGMTDERPNSGDEIARDDAGAWPPVIIGWTNPEVEPGLAGDVAGFAGSVQLMVSTTSPTGQTLEETAVFVTGRVALDGPQITDIIDYSPTGRAGAVAVVKHEVAHLVGLGHVDDPSEIMNPRGSAQVTDFGPGDLRGLNHLGRGPCVPEA